MVVEDFLILQLRDRSHALWQHYGFASSDGVEENVSVARRDYVRGGACKSKAMANGRADDQVSLHNLSVLHGVNR